MFFVQVDRIFTKRATLCLEGLEEAYWNPPDRATAARALRTDWREVPVDGGVRIQRSRSSGVQRLPSPEVKAQQVMEYESYLIWLEEACVVSCAESTTYLSEYLRIARKVHQDQRGNEGVPNAWRTRQ